MFSANKAECSINNEHIFTLVLSVMTLQPILSQLSCDPYSSSPLRPGPGDIENQF